MAFFFTWKFGFEQAKEEDVDRLHRDHVDNVNGSRDWRNEFHEWHETLSVSSYQQDLLHLLPYVVIDWSFSDPSPIHPLLLLVTLSTVYKVYFLSFFLFLGKKDGGLHSFI